MTDGEIVALARKPGADGSMTVPDEGIVAARTSEDIVLRRAHCVDATTVELRPESMSRSTGRSDSTPRARTSRSSGWSSAGSLQAPGEWGAEPRTGHRHTAEDGG